MRSLIRLFLFAACGILGAAESGSFKGPGVLYGKNYIPVDTGSGYRLSGEFRALQGPAPGIRFGIALFDEKKQLIASLFLADVPGSLTELAEPAAAGSKTILVKDASKWKKHFSHYVKVAFNAKQDYSDQPNRDISKFYINKVVKDGKYWKVELRGPLAKSYPAGTLVRQHKEGGFLNFVLNSETKLSPEWRKFEGTIKGYAAHGAPMDKFWKTTRFARIAVTVTGSKTPVEFRNLEFVKDDSIGKPVPAKLAAYYDFSTAKPQNHRIAAAEGKGNIYSQTGVFVQEEQSLRLAENFSFNMWVTLQRIQNRDILLDKNLVRGRQQFQLRLENGLPTFTYRVKGRLRGIRTVGEASNATATYAPECRKACRVSDLTQLRVMPGGRHMVTCVFNQGTVSIYIDGRLVLQDEAENPVRIDQTANDLTIGATFRKNDFRPQYSSTFRMEHLRIYSGCLNADEVKALYEKEKKVSGKRNYTLGDCRAYLKALIPDCDMMFERTLPRTAAYLKNLPKTAKISMPPGTVAKLRNQDNVIHFEVNGREYFPILATGATPGFLRKPLDKTGQYVDRMYADPAAAGLDILSFMPNAWIDLPYIWKGDRKYDFRLADLAVRKLIAIAPHAKIQFVIFPEPPNWFMRRFDAEMPRYHVQWTSSSEVRIFYTAPLASKIWRDSSCDLIYQLIRYLERQEYAGHIVDYKLWMAGGGEWHWPGCFSGGVGGYSKPTENEFREYLKKKYSTDAALQKAWNDPKVSFDTVKVPSPEKRLDGNWGYLIDWKTGVPGRDFRGYMCDCTLNMIRRCTRAMKEASAWKKTVTIYQGYSFYFFRSGNTIQYQSGFDIFRDVLNLDSVDHIGTPISYENRGLGNIGPNNNPFNGSAALHNKLLWQENDLRTHLRPTPEYGSTNTAEETRELLRRGFGMSLTTGTGFWYFVSYQFHDAKTLDAIAELKRLGDLALGADRRSAAEIALVFDEASMQYASGALRSQFIDDHCWFLYNKLFRTGAPFDCFLASDLGHPKMKDYKLYIMVNSFFADRKMREMVARKVRKNNAVVLWNYAPGIFSEKGRSEKNMADLTGIRLKFENKRLAGSLKVTDPKHPLTAAAKQLLSYPIQPMVWADDPGAQVLGKFQGRDALVVKKFKDWTSIYTLMPFTQEMLNGLCDYAGIHRYIRNGDVLTANRGFVALHTSRPGDKTISLPGKFDVKELYSGKVLGQGVSSFTDPGLPAKVSRLYQIIPAKGK